MRFDDLEKRVIKSAVAPSYAGASLVAMLCARFPYHSAEEWGRIVAAGLMSVNGATATADIVLAAGDEVEYHAEKLPEPEVEANYRVLYEDAAILAVEKPGNLPCHPAGPFYRNTLWFLLNRDFGAAYPINRLDRETSGVTLWAKEPTMAARLSRRLPMMEKRYVAAVHGSFSTPIDATGFLVRDDSSPIRKKRKFVYTECAGAQSASTRLAPLRSNGVFSLVEALPKTGRLHQIRATLFSLGFPLVGDKLYGVDDTIFLRIKGDAITAADRSKLLLPRQALHAASLTFIHPDTGNAITVESPLPELFLTLFA